MSNTSLLDYIDEIQNASIQTEYDVCSALADVYSKSISILECYDGDDYRSFSVFQEGVLKDTLSDTKSDLNGKSIMKKILLFIPRLLINLAKNIHRSLSKSQIDKLEHELEESRKMSSEMKEELDRLQEELNNVKKQQSQHIKDTEEAIADMRDRVRRREEKSDRHEMQIREHNLRISFLSEVVYFNFDFEKANEYLKQMRSYIDSLEKIVLDSQSYNRENYKDLFQFFKNSDVEKLVTRLGYTSVKASFYDAKQFMEEFKIMSNDIIRSSESAARIFERMRDSEYTDEKLSSELNELIPVLTQMSKFLTFIQSAGMREINRVYTGIRILKEAKPLPRPGE